ncbi:hypothetical protein HK414_17710 [Ramlibacter terrae]|uniref:GGDEF domain-containing protein n=1 Tax=Ramlibacter terrae TaxID=2732511 RepID=A0ABX6P541_9BURK|nr:hypothetical protein HK414_17710 [Ramlibacter terrae]
MQLQGLTRGMEPAERFADVAAPWLDSLCQQVEWPSDPAIHNGDDDFMVVLESSLRQSRFYVRRARGRVRVNLMGSAAGTAYGRAHGGPARRTRGAGARRPRCAQPLPSARTTPRTGSGKRAAGATPRGIRCTGAAATTACRAAMRCRRSRFPSCTATGCSAPSTSTGTAPR